MTENEKTARRFIWASGPATFAPLVSYPELWKISGKPISQGVAIALASIMGIIFAALAGFVIAVLCGWL